MDRDILDFIERHKLSINDFFDANGRAATSCAQEMISANKRFAYNTTPCKKEGHKISDKKGNCMVCNPAGIAFKNRTLKSGFIYIACSPIKQYTKVGMTTETLKGRLGKLNSRKVGNTNDWVIVFSSKCDKVASLELAVQKRLLPYRVKGDFYGDTESKELFRCSFQKAKEELDLYIEENNIELKEQMFHGNNFEKYKFKNLKNV